MAARQQAAIFPISEPFVLDLFSELCLMPPSRLTEGVLRRHTKAERGAAVTTLIGSGEVVAAAVERREGARAYVTGARDTSQGVPVLPRFFLVSDDVGRGGSGGAPGCGVPHQRPRGAPLPQGYPEGVILRCSSA